MARARTSPKAVVPVSKWLVMAALLAIALVAYANSFGLGLAQDSKAILAQDARIRDLSPANLKLIFEKNYWWPKTGDGLYRPVTTVSFLFNYAVLGNGPNPTGYHIANFLLHAINICLVYELALLLFRRAGPAFFAAALWAVHPIGTESVTSIVGRADLLATMAVLGGLLLYARSRQSWTPAALFVIAIAGVFAKENAAVLLGMMLLWDLSFGDGRPRLLQRWPEYTAVAASLIILWAVRHADLGGLPIAQPVYVDNPTLGADLLMAKWTAIKVTGLDLWVLLVPLSLSSDRSFDQIPLSGLSDPWAWIALLVVAAVLAVAVRQYRRDHLMFWLAGFLGIALLPTSNLVVPIGALMAERFLYLPSVAVAIAIAALAYRLKNQRQAQIVLAVILVLYAGRTIARNPAWNDDLTLASTDIPTTPRSFRLHDMLAKALFDQDARRNIDRILQEQEKSWEILSPLPPARSSEFPPAFLGIYYATKADLAGPSQSRQWYEKSRAVLLKAREISQANEKAYDALQVAHGTHLTTRTGFQQLYFNLANADLNLGNFPESVEALRYGRNLNPAAPEAYDGLSVAYSAMGNPAQAVVALLEKAQVDGSQPATIGAIRDVYLKIPDGACAFVQQGAAVQLNMACPRVQADLCLAWADLAQAYAEARQPDQSRDARVTAQRLGCQR